MSISNINNDLNILNFVGTPAEKNSGLSSDFASLLSNSDNQVKPPMSPHLTSVYVPQYISAPAESETSSIVKEFMDYMEKPTEEKYIERWLASHNITKEQLAQMDPEKRQAIMKQMAEDIKKEIELETAEKLQGKSASQA